MDTGKRIAHLRSVRGVSRASMSEALGIHQTTAAYWESGRRSPSSRSMASLLRFFGLTAGQFYSIRLPAKNGKR